MAHKKGVGSTDNGRDSASNRLGVKLYGGQVARAGNILVRQRGTTFHAGDNVYMGKDHTLHARIDGIVSFRKRKSNRTFISIQPIGDVQETVAKPKKATATISKPVTKPAVSPAAPATGKPVKVSVGGKKFKIDDLKIVEGIGPKIEQILNEAGYTTWEELANADAKKLKEILVGAGSRYQMHNPTTWPRQARMAVDREWAELEKYQDFLEGGVEPSA